MKGLLGVVLTCVPAAWVGLLAGAPWVARGLPAAGGLLYAVGSLVCHQLPERSFHVDGVQLPVCARCLGLYAGAAVGMAGWWLVRDLPRAGGLPVSLRRVLLYSALPTAATLGATSLGLGDASNVWRAMLALPLGGAGGLVAGAVVSRELK